MHSQSWILRQRRLSSLIIIYEHVSFTVFASYMYTALHKDYRYGIRNSVPSSFWILVRMMQDSTHARTHVEGGEDFSYYRNFSFNILSISGKLAEAGCTMKVDYFSRRAETILRQYDFGAYILTCPQCSFPPMSVSCGDTLHPSVQFAVHFLSPLI